MFGLSVCLPLSQRIPDAEWFTPHGQSEGLFCPRKARYPGLVSTGPRGVGMHWQRLSTDFWAWDVAVRSYIPTHCRARVNYPLVSTRRLWASQCGCSLLDHAVVSCKGRRCLRTFGYGISLFAATTSCTVLYGPVVNNWSQTPSD